MDGWKTRLLGVVAASALALMASCDNGPSAVETRDRTAEAAGADFERADYEVSGGGWDRDSGGDRSASRGGDRFADRSDRGSDRAGKRDRAGERTPTFDGKPLWSANRRYSAAENAAYHFRKNGKDFGARNVDDYVGRAHAFIDRPPAGTLKLTRRNGDRLFYHPASNTFAVATRQGAPRTMFKPEEGMAYWREQIDREERRASGRGKSRDDRDGERRRGRDRSAERDSEREAAGA